MHAPCTNLSSSPPWSVAMGPFGSSSRLSIQFNRSTGPRNQRWSTLGHELIMPSSLPEAHSKGRGLGLGFFLAMTL